MYCTAILGLRPAATCEEKYLPLPPYCSLLLGPVRRASWVPGPISISRVAGKEGGRRRREAREEVWLGERRARRGQNGRNTTGVGTGGPFLAIYY